MTLRELRKRKRLTQEEVADIGGLDQTAVSQIERAKITDPHLSTVQNLAAAYGVKLQVIVDALAATLKGRAA